MCRNAARRTTIRTALAALIAVCALLPLAPVAAQDGAPSLAAAYALPVDLTHDELGAAGASLPTSIAANLLDNARRDAFRRAALDVGEAYWATDLRYEPNLNQLSVGYSPPSPGADEARDSALSRLVRLSSRRQLSAAEAWQQHLSRMPPGDAQCAADVNPLRCTNFGRRLVSRIEPAADGALELLAPFRTRGTSVNAFDYLTVAFEIDVWRPAGVHPMLAEAARNSAAIMRLRTASHEHPCGVTALWVVAAVTAEIPDITLIGDGQWHRPDRVVTSRSVTLNAAARGCRAAATLVQRYVDFGVEPPAWPFWDRHLVEAVSNAAADGTVDTIDRMTAGAMRSRPRSPIADDAPAVASYRACDHLPSTIPYSETVSVRGYRVAPCLADSLRALLDAASADGIVLNGWGWRSTLTQIRLRQRYCPLPPASSDQYWLQLSQMQSIECSPPVARPTSSMHESGRAVDFSCGNHRGSLRPGNSCFEWLSDNAHHYGLYNFTLEPWHWSTNGR